MSGNEEKHCVIGGDLASSGVVGPAGGAKPFLSRFAGNVTLRTARDMKRSRMHIIYSGHVQGVGFRYAAKSVAPGFEVAGVVRNLPDGRVELIAEGQRAELESFRQAIRDSGLDHFIRDEQVSWTEAAGEFRGFEIVR
jgi:acylphosphatase